jgi:hypothetical protein
MIFQKQVQFSKLLKLEGRVREFNFLKLTNVSNPTFTIDVSDERGKRYIFLFSQEGSEWKISGEDLPHWIMDSADLLRLEIEASVEIAQG